MASVQKQKPGEHVVRHVFQETQRDSPEFRTWFRGDHTNFNPKLKQMTAADAAQKYVLHGWVPETPQIGPDTKITAFGSCFAANISNWLSSRSFRVLNKSEQSNKAYVVTMGEGMVNSFVIRQQFEWAWENKVFEQALWHGYRAEEYGYDENIRLETKKLFDETEVFILTFGLSEVWYDELTGNVFWRTIPKDAYDPERHKFRVASVEENRENIRAIYELIRKHRRDAKVIITLSPVPLIATFRDVSCISANSVSKASLRVAIDEVVREANDEDRLYYWPSYELITDVFRSPFKPDRRHMPEDVLNHVMRLFELAWCTQTDIDELEFLESWIRASIRAGLLPQDLLPVLAGRKPWAIRDYLRDTTLHADEDIDTAWRKTLEELRKLWRQERNATKPAGETETV